MGGVTCHCCGAKLVRHLKFPVTLRDALSFDGPFPDEWEWGYYDKGEWWRPKPAERVHLPIQEYTYEDGMAQYLLWTEECRGAKDQLLVAFVDLGLVRGGEDPPWYGSVLLGAFRGRHLADIDPEVDDDMHWLTLAQKFAAEPKLLKLPMEGMQELIQKVVHGNGV